VVIVAEPHRPIVRSGDVAIPAPDPAHVHAQGRVVGALGDAQGGHWAYVDRMAGPRAVRVARPFPPSAAARSVLLQVLALASLIAVVLAMVLAEYLTRTIQRPIAEMTDAANALGRGDLRTRVRPRGRDELGALGAAIDQMADQLVDRVEVAQQEQGRLRTV